MSEYNYNFGGTRVTNGVFKMPSVPAASFRNPTVITENTDNSMIPDLKMIEQRLDILKLICSSEEMHKIEVELGRHLAEANRMLGDICFQKLGERLLGSNVQSFPIGINSVHSMNLRNNSRTQTTDNYFGLLCPLISASGYASNNQRTISSNQGFADNTGTSVQSQVFKKPAPSVKKKTEEIPEPRVVVEPSLRNRTSKKSAPSKRKTEEISEPRVSAAPSEKLPRVNEPIRNAVKKSSNIPKLREMKVLPSDDEDDSIMTVLEKMTSRKVKKKKNDVNAEPNNSQEEISVASSGLDDDECSTIETIVAQKQPSEAKIVKTNANHAINSDRSPDTTFNPQPLKEHNGLQAVRKKKINDGADKRCSDAAKRKQTLKNNTNAKMANTRKSEKTSSRDAPEANSVGGLEELNERSFFSNISSIDGGDLSQIGNFTRGKDANKSNNHRQYDPFGFLSPMVNARSTSGFSAISTPLSKTAVKNAMDKRLKKPNVAAELKDQLTKRGRKPKTVNVAPMINQAESSELESDCPASDLSY